MSFGSPWLLLLLLAVPALVAPTSCASASATASRRAGRRRPCFRTWSTVRPDGCRHLPARDPARRARCADRRGRPAARDRQRPARGGDRPARDGHLALDGRDRHHADAPRRGAGRSEPLRRHGAEEVPHRRDLVLDEGAGRARADRRPPLVRGRSGRCSPARERRSATRSCWPRRSGSAAAREDGDPPRRPCC